MNIDSTIHIYDGRRGSHHGDVELAVASLIETIHTLCDKVDIIMANQDQLATRLNTANSKLDKVSAEVTGLKTAFEELKTAQGGEVTPAVESAMTTLEEKLSRVDDIIGDQASA